MVYIQTGN